ncbi:hypothetical protein HC356_01480 [Wolbachia pipientis]|uniref:Uncharacterized protein n=1 Tax=Wolbachia pipientis TaxID=955 RepID=A0A7G5CE68_WOLPI|nr:hypothetical protein HC356_01480 [Wolbachia pipientis]
MPLRDDNCQGQRLYDVIPVPRHWDPEKLIMYYTTFSIKSWIPVPSTGMTPLLGSFSYKH